MGRPKRIKCKTREEWLSKRTGIGGSDCAAILGLSPWKTANDLWMEKTGQRSAPDLSGNEAVQTGVRLEPALRGMFKAIHPEYKVSYEPFDMWFQEERPYSFATLDGRIKTADGKVGVLEIKTSSPSGKSGWEKWQGRVPDNYFLQCCHQAYCLNADFVILFACLFNSDGDFTVREYRFERADIQEDIDYLLVKEDEFWKSVQAKTLPPMTLLL